MFGRHQPAELLDHKRASSPPVLSARVPALKVPPLIAEMREDKPRREIKSNLFPTQSPRRKERKNPPKRQENNPLLATFPTVAPHFHRLCEHSQALNS